MNFPRNMYITLLVNINQHLKTSLIYRMYTPAISSLLKNISEKMAETKKAQQTVEPFETQLTVDLCALPFMYIPIGPQSHLNH